MTNLDSILKSRDITLLTEVCLVNAMVFPAVMYGYESWTIRKAALVAQTVKRLSTMRVNNHTHSCKSLDKPAKQAQEPSEGFELKHPYHVQETY